MTQRLRNLYNTRIVPKLMGEFDYKNKLQVTRIQKIVINRGLGDASQNAKILESSLKEIYIYVLKSKFKRAFSTLIICVFKLS